MIRRYSLIAQYEFDDENEPYGPPSALEPERVFGLALHIVLTKNALAETHFEGVEGSLSEAFGLDKP